MKLIQDQRQTRAIVDHMVGQLSRVIEKHVDREASKLRAEFKQELHLFEGRMTDLEAQVTEQGGLGQSGTSDEVQKKLEALRVEVEQLKAKLAPPEPLVHTDELLKLFTTPVEPVQLGGVWGPDAPFEHAPKSSSKRRRDKGSPEDAEKRRRRKEDKQVQEAKKASLVEKASAEEQERLRIEAAKVGASGSGTAASEATPGAIEVPPPATTSSEVPSSTLTPSTGKDTTGEPKPADPETAA